MTPVTLTIVGERYRLLERIGAGSSGVVWRATDEVLGRDVAVKLLRGELADDAEARERLRVEARAAASLSVPGVARVYDYGVEQTSEGPVSYLVMELVAGESLRDLLARDGSMPVAATMDLVAQTAGALAAVHALGIVHRDVKPANLLVGPAGEVTVTDFGIARVADAEPLTRTGTLVGTAQYLSPERALGKPAGTATDVYSLGVIAYECLTGARPYPSESPVVLALAHATEEFPRLPATVPPTVAALVAAMTAKEPADRPTAAEVAARARLAHDRCAAEQEPAPTRTMTAVLDADVPHVERLPDDEEPSGRSARQRALGLAGRPAALALAALLLVVCLAAAVALVSDGSGSTASAVAVPKVTGLDTAQATAALEQAGLAARVRQRDVAGVETGRVTAQQPTSGATLAPGSAVVLTAATGEVVVRSADYVGMRYSEAAAALRKLGLQVRRGKNPGAPTSSITSGLAPTGTVAVGRTVVVDVIAPAPPVVTGPDAGPPSGKGADGKGKKGKKGKKGD